MTDDLARIGQGRQMLSEQGFNLFAVLEMDMLPTDLEVVLTTGGVDTDAYSRLIMIGHGGNLMWERLGEAGLEGSDPVDDYSVRIARRFIEEFLGGCEYLILYPGALPVPLQQLGSIAGWHHDSPLGVGVNRRYGPWFGYRVVMLVRAEIPVFTDQVGPSPCAYCPEKPCVAACPAGALSADGSPEIVTCIAHRVTAGSRCAYKCHARTACPAGSAHRYGEDQIRYFYGKSLESIKAYLAKR